MASALHARIAGLDAARALAIGLVLVSHYGQAIPWWFGPRWAATIPTQIGIVGTYGVVLFFALSGFLIGRIAIDIARSAPDADTILRFLIRRWMRTLPLYFVALLLFLVATPPTYDVGWHVAHYATLTQNFLTGLPTGEWFAVAWSLTVEEWFYLFLSVFGLGLAMLVPADLAIWAAILALMAVPIWLRWTWPQSMWFAYADVLWFDCIALGVAVAWLDLAWPCPWILAGALGLIGIGLAAIVVGDQLALPSHLFVVFLPSVMSLSCGLCLPLFARWRGPRLAAISWLSTRSYGLYLVHSAVLLPINSLVAPLRPEDTPPFWPSAIGTVVALALPFLLAEFAYRLIERPIMRRRPAQLRWTSGPAVVTGAGQA